MKLARLPFLSLLLVLTGCGFHLRGQGVSPTPDSPPPVEEKVYVAAGQDSFLRDVLKELLRQQHIPLAGSRDRAEVVITLSGEKFDRRVLSVDPDTGKAREFQIAYRARVRAERNGRELFPAQTLQQLRDYLFDETAVLGKTAEESQLRKEILQASAQTVLRMVRRALQR